MRGDPVLPLPQDLTSTQMVSALSELILLILTVSSQKSTFDIPFSGCYFMLFCQRMILLALSDHHQEKTFATQWRNKRGKKKQCFSHWSRHPLILLKLLCSDPIHTCCLAFTVIRLSLVMFSGRGFKKINSPRLFCFSLSRFLCFWLSHQAQALRTSSTPLRAKISPWKLQTRKISQRSWNTMEPLKYLVKARWGLLLPS